MSKVKDVKKQTGADDDAMSGRNSVSSAIAHFQNNINMNSGRGPRPQESHQKANAAAVSRYDR